MATITSTAQLVQSTQSRSGTPDGNIYFNPDGTMELITVEELAQVDLGAGLVANPLTNADGISMLMCYTFERQERRTDENLRELEVFIRGNFKFAGAYNFVNGRKLSTLGVGGGLTDDRQKIRGSGFIEFAADGSTDRIYFGARSLGNIEAASQGYYQLVQNGAATDLAFAGPVNEVIQVFGSTANGDAGAGDFDNRSFLALSVRTWGQVHDRKTIGDSGISEMAGYLGAFGLTEVPNARNAGTATITDVYDTNSASQAAPWTGVQYETLASAETLTGLNGGSGDFSQVIRNPNNASLNEIVAWMDAAVIADEDIDDGAGTRNGKQNPTLYTLDTQGRVVLEDGLYIENVPVADQQDVIMVDDLSATRTYQFVAGGVIQVGANAAADANAWYHMFLKDGTGSNDFNTLDAITINDASSSPIKGNVSGLTSIPFSIDYDGFSQGGVTPGTDFVVVVEVEGDGGATARKVEFTITRSTGMTIVCEPDAETNL